MSIPYLPGWWDSIDKNALGSFIGGATQAFAPDATAKFRFDKMVQQDPTLITQISNLDPTQREAFASALGFKNYGKSGLGNIAESQELIDRRETQEYKKSLSGRQKDIMMSGRLGTQDQTTIDRGDTLFSLGKKEKETGIQKNEQEIQLNQIKLKEASDMQTLMDSLKVKYPAENINLQDAMMSYINGKADTPELQRIIGDPTLAPLFTNLVDLYKQRLGLQAQKDIAGMKTQQEKLWGIQFLQQGVDNALQRMNAASAIIKGFGVLGPMQQKPEYVQALQEYESAKEEHGRYVTGFQSALKSEFGGKYPDVFKPEKGGLSTGPVGPVNDKIAKTLKLLQEGKITMANVMTAVSLSDAEKAIIKAQVGGK